MIALVPKLVHAESDSYFTVSRLEIAGSVENLEPVGVVDIFAASTEKVYCFLEASAIEQDTTVSFIWYHRDKRMAIVNLPLKKGAKWRTYSSKRLGGLKGEWRVELQDADSNVLQTVGFTVE
jgi:hypothetical protein